MKTLLFPKCLILFFIAVLITLSGCSKKNFEWEAEKHTKELDKKKGYKKKKHRANYHRWGQHHSKKSKHRR